MHLKKHKNLDKKIWENDDTLHTDVHNMLMAIVWNFIDYVRTKRNMDIRNSDLCDVFIFGSITNYFYDKKSDIDMCIVLNLENLKQNYQGFNILQTLRLYYYDWAMIRHCSIHGRKIDLNFADINEPLYVNRYRSGPNYSILKQTWIFKPVPVSDKDFKDIVNKGLDIYKQVIHNYNLVKRNGFRIEDMENFFKDFMAYKRAVHHINFEQNITPMYVAYHKIKRRGIIKTLQNKMQKRQTQKFTLK